LRISLRAVISGLLITLAAVNVWPLLLLNLGVPLAAFAEAIFLGLFLWWTGGGPPHTTKPPPRHGVPSWQAVAHAMVLGRQIKASVVPAQLAFELHAYVQEANWAFKLFDHSTLETVSSRTAC
jgi:hypothetical protein